MRAQGAIWTSAVISTIAHGLMAFGIAAAIHLGCASMAYAQKRTALVIGNEQYESISSAPKAELDSRAVAEALSTIGLHPVIQHSNLKRVEMSRAIEYFASSIEPNDGVVFYFSGNGVAINSQNFLLPVDVPAARAGEESGVVETGISLGTIIAKFQGRGANVLSIIDASRDNPFDRPNVQPPDSGTGLARVSDVPALSFLLLSASPKESARYRTDKQDANPNSVFGRELLAFLSEPDISISELAINVQSKVRELAQQHGFHQVPIFYDGGIGRTFYLSGRSIPKYPDSLRVRSKPDGSKRFKLSEVADLEGQLPTKEDCAKLGQRFDEELRREGGDSVRFWVRMGRGDIGYCQHAQNRWFVEYYDRNFQDALVIDFTR
jgi:hypothetical protein